MKLPDLGISGIWHFVVASGSIMWWEMVAGRVFIADRSMEQIIKPSETSLVHCVYPMPFESTICYYEDTHMHRYLIMTWSCASDMKSVVSVKYAFLGHPHPESLHKFPIR
jgi:hypothetical protein